jgi:pyroglutamyl-peptidase
MAFTILLTGFGPFPGAPFNPTGPLVEALARRPHSDRCGIRRVSHVFETSYATVDRELPALLEREQPNVLIMFGLAQRSRHIRIETRARNVLAAVPDASGRRPAASVIAPGAPETLSLPAPTQRLLAAARSAGTTAALSSNAGGYLCNYLCWRACEAVERDHASNPTALRLAAFVHVPNVNSQRMRKAPATRARPFRPALTLDDLIRVGEAIGHAALAAARISVID